MPGGIAVLSDRRDQIWPADPGPRYHARDADFGGGEDRISVVRQRDAIEPGGGASARSDGDALRSGSTRAETPDRARRRLFQRTVAELVEVSAPSREIDPGAAVSRRAAVAAGRRRGDQEGGVRRRYFPSPLPRAGGRFWW